MAKQYYLTEEEGFAQAERRYSDIALPANAAAAVKNASYLRTQRDKWRAALRLHYSCLEIDAHFNEPSLTKLIEIPGGLQN